MTLTKVDVKKIVEMCGNDGHSILSPEALAGVNEEFVKAVTRTYVSDLRSPKSTITKDGKVVPETKGIYTLDVLAWACQVLNLEADADYFGRGRQAAGYTAALKKWLEE